VLGTGAHIRCEGKGRTQRSVPLTAPAQAMLSSWVDERAGYPHDPLFTTRSRRRLSRDAIERRLATHTTAAAKRWPSLNGTAAPARPPPQLRDVAAAGRSQHDRDRALT
jgi:site-specific recombinase XerD